MKHLLFSPLVSCWLLAGAAAAAERGPVTMLADFEPGSEQPFQGGVVERQPALEGEGALRVDGGSVVLERAMDWSGYDVLQVDVFHPGTAPVTLWLEVRDAETKGYWTRVNLTTLVPPGRSVVSVPTSLYVGEKSRPGRSLLKDRVTRFAITVGEGGPVFFDRFRFATLDTAAVRFPELVAIDFGPAGAPVLEGFTAVADQPWDEAAGFGWVGARVWRVINAFQPEPLTQDFACPESGSFRVRVSNGTYRVGFNLTSPNGYWGETQAYRSRRVSVNGRTVVDEQLDFQAYLARYFRHAESEDLPGVSAFERYVREPLAELWTTTEVTNGLLDLSFEGQGWSLCLSHLIAYPEHRRQEGERFRDWVLERRRFHFENYFKMLPAARSGAPAPEEGFRLFRRHVMDTVGPLDGPRAGEELVPGAVLRAQAAPGEEVAVTFAVQPAAAASAPAARLEGPLHNERGVALQAADVSLGWIDYRLARVAMDGSIYEVRPRYWRTGAPPATPGITRRYWLRWQPPAGTPPGVYTGAVVLAAGAGASPAVALELEVLPFTLEPVRDLAVGPWGSGIRMGWFDDDPDTRQWDDRMFEAALDALRRHGFTTLSGRPHLQLTWTNGGFALDTARADREMALLKAKGFRHLISSYGIHGIGYSLYRGPKPEEVQRAGCTSAVEFLRVLYGRVEEHARAQQWLPVAWNLCDEPIGADIPPAVSNAWLHRVAGQGLQQSTFMGATSMQGADPADPHYALVQALPMPTLTLHDEAALGVVKESGNQFAYYNGGDRWTYGRYMKMLEDRHDLKLRINWHYNVAAGDPYHALDCREDDYCWYNSNARGELIPSLSLLQDMVPGLNDYRYLLTLERELARRPDAPGAAKGQAVLAEVRALRAGTNAREGSARLKNGTFALYDQERAHVISAILGVRAPDRAP